MKNTQILSALLSLLMLPGLVLAQSKSDPNGGSRITAHDDVKGALRARPVFNGPKKLLAVTKFENKSGWDGQWELGSGMAEMLTQALMDSGRFIVVERQQIEDVLKEQDFSQSGRTVDAAAPKIGKVLNTQILVTGAVTEFAYNKSGGGGGVRVQGFTLGGGGSTAHVALIIRIIDTTTGQVLDSQRVVGDAKTNGLNIGYADRDWGLDLGGFKKTPLGTATQAAVDQAVYIISNRMESVPFQGKVIKVDGEKVYLNCGETYGIKVGDTFTVYHPGEELIDPDTGLSLGSDTKKVGQVEIAEVKEKFSIAKITGGTGIAAKDIVKME